MSDGPNEEAAEWASWFRMPFFWLAIVTALLLGVTYYGFFFPPTHVTLSSQSEEFFFEANQAAGAPVLVLSAWLFYRRSHYMDLLRGPGSLLSASLIAALSGAFFAWGHFTESPDIQLATSMGMVFALVIGLGGHRAAKAFWVPIVFLGFALPLSPVLLSAVMFPIQLATAQYAGLILNGIGVTSLVQGDQILRPENTFIVIETCSGVRTIVTLTMLTVLLIDLFEREGVHAVALLALAPVVAFLTNGFRVVTLVLNPHSAIHSIHNLQGIAMLLVGLTAMYGLDGLLARVLGSRDALVESGDYGTSEDRSGLGTNSLGFLPGLVALVGMLVASWTLPIFRPPLGLEERPAELFARLFADSARQELRPDFQFRGSIRYLAHSNYGLRVDGEPVEIFLGVGHEQLRAHTLLTKRLAWPDSGFAVVEEGVANLAGDSPGGSVDGIVAPGASEAKRMVLRRGARSVLSYSWYERAKSLPVEWFRQAFALDRSPFHRDSHILALRISTPIGVGPRGLEAAEARIRALWGRVQPELDGYARVIPHAP